MSILDTETWAQVRAAYDANDVTVEAIALSFGIPHKKIYARLKQEGWTLRTASSRTSPPNRSRSERTVLRAIRKDVIARLYKAIDLKLTQMETLMQTATETTSSDHERETRTLALLVRNFERVTELNADLMHPAGKSDPSKRPAAEAAGALTLGASAAPASPASPPHDAFEAERQRRDIAQRLERILAVRNAP